MLRLIDFFFVGLLATLLRDTCQFFQGLRITKCKHAPYTTGYAVLVASVAMCVGERTLAQQSSIGYAEIQVLGSRLDIDTRADQDGMQYQLTAVKNIQTAVYADVGVLRDSPILDGATVQFEINGPQFQQPFVVSGETAGPVPLPVIVVPGDYFISNVVILDANGDVLLAREPTLPLIQVTVIDEILLSQVTSRPLTAAEIADYEIEIDEDNFQAVSFTVGLTFGSDVVDIDLPVVLPLDFESFSPADVANVNLGLMEDQNFDYLPIPNLTLTGFVMRSRLPDFDPPEFSLPPISGVIILPGNIGYLNQFFSVLLQTTNLGPEGSGLEVRNAKAEIRLPLGGDNIPGSGDDPLRLAETASAGAQSIIDLADSSGSTTILPQATNSAEFLVEGLREGTHRVDIDITGELVVPATGETVELLGEAAGVVEVANPTFDLVLSHPEVVREDDQYTVYASVTNTSKSPANNFQLALSNRSLTGTELAPGETPTRTLETLAPGQTEVFEFEFISKITGEVTGTVFLADDAVNGSYVLTMGVGDAGIPLSPSRLSLPGFAKYLPESLRSSGLRLLGQAYSNATAPNGALPEGIPRIAKSTVIERARDLGLAGLHNRFGDSDVQNAQDMLMTYFGSDIERLDTLVADEEDREKVRNSLTAFDVVRRVTESGNLFDQTLAELIGDELPGSDLSVIIGDLAQRFASRPVHLSFGVSSDTPARLAMATTDAQTGWVAEDSEIRRDIPHSGYLSLHDSDTQNDVLILNARPDLAGHTFSFSMQSAGNATPTLLLPGTDGSLRLVLYPSVGLPAEALAIADWSGGDAVPVFEIDTDRDGQADQSLAATSAEEVVDQPPQIAEVHQWGKGESPVFWLGGGARNLDFGDSLGRLVGVLFNEELDRSQFDGLQFGAAGIGVSDTTLSTGNRLAFIELNKPVGPFVERELSASGVPDLQGNSSGDLFLAITADPDLGDGARLVGQVVDPAGKPVPNAQVRYEQLVEICSEGAGCIYGVSYGVYGNLSADFDGRFELDFVLQNSRGAYRLSASEMLSDNSSEVSGLVNFNGQELDTTIVLRGAGKLEGYVYNPDGSPLVGSDPDPPGSILVIAQNLETGQRLQSWVDAEGKYEFPRSYEDGDGNVISAGEPEVGNYVLSVVNSAEGTTGVADATLNTNGATISQDIVLQPAVNFGTVSGTVFEADGSTAAAGVDLQVKASAPGGFSDNMVQFFETLVARVQTDENGSFNIEQVPVGDIEVLAQRPLPFAQRIVPGFLDNDSELELTILLPGLGGTVTGIIRDSEANLVAKAIVVAGPHATVADENGYFEINNLPIGEVTVFSQRADAVALGTQVVSTNGPDDVQNVVVTLQPTGDIVGTLYDNDGATTLSNQNVQLWFVRNEEFENERCCVIAETETDSDGYFEFVDYPVGDYSVRVVLGTGSDGGWSNSEIRFAGDRRDVDVYLRGIGQFTGRVVQSNGTPAISDVIVSGKQWRIATADEGRPPNPYLEAIGAIIEELPNEGEAAAEFAQTLQSILDSTGAGALSNEFYILANHTEILSSDELGPGGEVLGDFTSSQIWAPDVSTTVAAFGPFLAPTEVTATVPITTIASEREIDVGDIVLEPLNGAVAGTVYMPDRITPVGENALVQLNTIGSSGSVCPGYLDACINQPVLPNLDALTDENGRFEFPLTQPGIFRLTADTGVPDAAIRATQIADIVTEPFLNEQGDRALNVRLFGTAGGSVPRGAEVEVDVVLMDSAGVRIVVTEADGTTPIEGAEITLKDSVAANDEAFGESFNRILSNAQGVVEFFPIPSGDFTVTALKEGRPSPGVFNGSVPVLVENGVLIPAAVKLGSITDTGGGSIPTAVFGKISGQVLTAAGEPVLNPTQITITGTDVDLLGTTDADGNYEIEFVPGGELLVEAYEPYSGRRGQTLATLAVDGESVTVNVQLIGVGSVSGQVVRNGSVVPGADVRLTTEGDGRVLRDLVTRSDSAGLYTFDGVPVGDYTVSAYDPESRLSGRATGAMTNDGAQINTDIDLQASGQITGTVFAAGASLDADGNVVPGAEVVPFAEVNISTSPGNLFSQTTQADVNGSYTSGAFVPVGDYKVTARAPSRADGVEELVTVLNDGQVLNKSLVLLGSGTVRGQILNSLGASPIDKAQVTLVSRSPYSDGSVSRITDDQGMFVISDVPVGQYTVTVTTTLQAVPLGTTFDGEITTHNQTVAYIDGDEDLENNAITLQASGSITGQIFLADGISFAVDAVVEIDSGPLGGGQRIRAVADVNALGQFTAAALPLGTYDVILSDPQSNASNSRRVTIADNGEDVDLGTIVLDGERPVLLATSPAQDNENVASNSIVSVQFSEALSVDTVTAQTVLVSTGGVSINGTVTLSSDQTTVEFTPAALLPDESSITVLVKGEVVAFDGTVTSTGIEDLSGRGLNGDQQFTFTTGDSTPPTVISLTPIDGSVNTDVSSVVRIEFDESIDVASVQSFELTLNGEAIDSTVTVLPGFDNRVFVLQPTSLLQVDNVYRAVLTGPITDVVGNAMAETELATQFATPDTLAPEDLTIALVDGQLPIQGRTVEVVIEGTATDIASVEFSVNGESVDTISEPPYVSIVELTPVLGPEVQLSAVAVDSTGNRGSSVSLDLQVLVNNAPVVAITLPSSPQEIGEAIHNIPRSVDLVFEVNDDASLTQVVVLRGDTEIESFDPAGEATLNGTVSVPIPYSPSAGDALEIVIVATDDQGDTGSAALSIVFVVDDTAPMILATQPAVGAEGVSPDQSVIISFSKPLYRSSVPDKGILFEDGLSIAADTDWSADYTELTITPDSGTFAPRSFANDSQIAVVVPRTAEDLAGNTLGSDYLLQFSTGSGTSVDSIKPRIAYQRPAANSTAAPVNSVIFLYLDEPLSDSGLADALSVSAGGVAVAGSTQLLDEGRVIKFTPEQPLPFDTRVDVNMAKESLTDLAGNELALNYSAWFTTPNIAVPDSRLNLADGQGDVPTNVAVELHVDAAIDPATVTADNLYLGMQSLGCLVDSKISLPIDVSLFNSDHSVQITPVDPLDASTTYNVCIANLETTDGRDVFSRTYLGVRFRTGTLADETYPGIVAISPPDQITNLPVTTRASVLFDEEMNLASAAEAITLEDSDGNVIEGSYSNVGGTNWYYRVLFIPYAPLKPFTSYTFTVAGAPDLAGNPSPVKSVTFTTGNYSDAEKYRRLFALPEHMVTEVGTNTTVIVGYNETLDITSIPSYPKAGLASSSRFLARGGGKNSVDVEGELAANADVTTVEMVPDELLQSNSQHALYGVGNATDLSGNTRATGSASSSVFTTAEGVDNDEPVVVSVNIVEGLADLPTNFRFRVRFNEPVRLPNAEEGWGLQDDQGNEIPVRLLQNDGARVVEMIPLSLLETDRSYSASFGNASDSIGNVVVDSQSFSFTTGSGIDIQTPEVVSQSPMHNQNDVEPSLASIELQFDDAIDPTYLDDITLTLTRTDTNTELTVDAAFDSTQCILHITPAAGFESGVDYLLNYLGRFYDLAGNQKSLRGTLRFATQ